MDFFDYQDRTRRLTRWLVFYYIVAMLSVCFAVYATIWMTGVLIVEKTEFSFWNPLLMFQVFGILFLAMIGGTFWKSWMLSHGGGGRIARLLGGRKISPSTSDALERRLMNIVEEISIAVGIPIPDVYVLDRQNRVNAFAAGPDRDSVVVGVTHGALEVLNRDELQGVIAHEFSHVINDDIRLNHRLIGVLFGLEMITQSGLILLRRLSPTEWSGTLWQSQTHIPIIDGFCNAIIESLQTVFFWLFRFVLFLFFVFAGGGLAMLGAIGMVFGMMIKSLISKQREYLADAGSVRFTRNPSGIGGALKKIGCRRIDSIVYNDYALEASHIFFGSVLGQYDCWNPFSTHPKLLRRVRRIEPDFDGVFPSEVLRDQAIRSKADRDYRPPGLPRIVQPPPQLSKNTQHKQSIPFSTVEKSDNVNNTKSETIVMSINDKNNANEMENGVSETLDNVQDDNSQSLLIFDGFLVRRAEDIVGMIGHVDAEELQIAAELIDSLPQELLDAVHRTDTAVGIVYALLLNREPEHRRKQLEVLADHSRPEIFDLVVQWIDHLNTFAPQSRLPLIQMTLPSLRLLESDDYVRFRKNINRLTKADGRLDLFEYTVRSLLIRPLDIHFELAEPYKIRYYNIKEIRRSLEIILSHLAWAGHVETFGKTGKADVSDMENSTKLAFKSGSKNIGVPMKLLPKDQLNISDWDAALKELLLVDPPIKRRILSSMVECICFDGRITAREGELIRAICAAMDCPMPPLGSAHNRIDIYQLGEEV